MTRRVGSLEGLRGIAAMQVVGLHFVTGFLPDTAEHAWAPLRLLFDGHTAVYVFFLISGAVLTPSFARGGGFVATLGRRVVRLGVPVAAAATVACGLLALMPQAHLRAAALAGSGWLAMDSSGAATPAHLVREIGLDALLLGYRETTLFAPLAAHLPLMQNSLDAPFWSLHVELYGSLLVLMLVWLRARAAWLHGLAIAAAALAFGTDPLFLFVLGHLSAARIGRRPGVAGGALGAVSLALGVWLCLARDWPVVETIRLALSASEVRAAPDLFQFQSQLGALALYAGVVLCPGVWPVLESAALRRLGRLSFGIYLLHFPIMFTLGCLVFLWVEPLLPYGAAVAATFAAFLAAVFRAAGLFERWVDRPAVSLSHRIARPRARVAPDLGCRDGSC